MEMCKFSSTTRFLDNNYAFATVASIFDY